MCPSVYVCALYAAVCIAWETATGLCSLPGSLCMVAMVRETERERERKEFSLQFSKFNVIYLYSKKEQDLMFQRSRPVLPEAYF